MWNYFIRTPGRLWSLGWVLLVRAILYMVVAGFLAQYLYFGEIGWVYRPYRAMALLACAFAVNFLLLVAGSDRGRADPFIGATYVIDLAVLTLIAVGTGGFSSVFIPYFIPVLVMAPAWLPRRYTAIFPSAATLGVAYIALAHLLVSPREKGGPLTSMYPEGVLSFLRYSPPHAIVANMLILTLLFFVIAYLSGVLSDKLLLEQRLNSEVLSSMTEGVAVVGRDRKLVFANAEFFRLFPSARPGADFRPVIRKIPGLEEAGVDVEHLLAGGLDGTLVVTSDDSVPPHLETRISRISIHGGRELFGFFFMVIDLTMRRRMEEAERNLARFSAISTMSAGLAHEIRNPLASLRSAIQEIGESFPPASQNRVLTDVVITESDRLDRIIGRFLDFSREEELRLRRRRLGLILEDIRLMMRHGGETERLVIEIDAEDDPEVKCDVDRVKEVFLNLALNAAQFAPREGGRLDISLRAAKREATPGVEILFRDNGPGIDREAMRHIFEPFYSNREGGTGMGLPLSRKQISMHGGDITASNLPGGGACFRVWLPLEAVVANGTRIRRPGSYTEIIRKPL